MSRLILACLLVFALAGNSCQAGVVEAEGKASLERGRAIAREEAIRDALQQAALQDRARIESASLVQKGVVLDSVRLTSPVVSKLIDVKREWEKDGLYFVRIRAHNEQQSGNRSKLRKRISGTWFPVVNSLQIQDLDRLSKRLPEAILRRMEVDGGYIVPVDMVLPSLPDAVTPDAVKSAANLANSQFLLAGKIINASVMSGFWPFKESKRQIELEIKLYDGYTGALISRHLISDEANGSVLIGDGIPFGSRAFFDTETGEVITFSEEILN